ncbi:Casein kinase I isoform alpha [Tritrichomonas foetus]|uniref:non-specific serine/threonine protein kinase n=1 Tax=Tritrichomonas foetus TaxID=1144522 RepID=A0A1J4JY17_9EUKA|nr:Casein kinase I isoform alpha [Tritrichomonas foetus]|eukprot:OHT04055.1 Casein kinase I isoform alpha [Tritrichomonas foetus]
MTEANHRPEFQPGEQICSFEVIRHVGSGGYGDIYAVKDVNWNEIYAIKIEFLDAPQMCLHVESAIMKKLQGSLHFPRYIAEGMAHTFRYIALELLGPSLSTMRRALPQRKYTAYSILRLSYEMVVCIQQFHKTGYAHRDIKPGNFLIRPNREYPLCLIDFGLANSFINQATGDHIPFKANVGFTGTWRYASLNAHNEVELSRRDDLISWFYSILELVDGSVPWPGSHDRNETEKMKQTMTAEQLCIHLPSEYISIYKYIMKIKFDEVPDYDFIKNQLIQALKRHEFNSFRFDWEFLKQKDLDEISAINLEMGDEPSNVMYGIQIDSKCSLYSCCSCCNVA